MLSKIVLVTALCELCFYYNDLYDLTVVHSNRELVVRLLQAAGAATIVLAAACLAFPTLLLDPEHLRHRARRVRRRGADLADRVQPPRPRSAPRGTAADRRHRPDRAQARAADRAPAGLRLPARRLRRRDRRRGDGPPARRARLRGGHRPDRRASATSTASSSACRTAAAGCRSSSCCAPRCRASASRTRPRPTSG